MVRQKTKQNRERKEEGKNTQHAHQRTTISTYCIVLFALPSISNCEFYLCPRAHAKFILEKKNYSSWNKCHWKVLKCAFGNSLRHDGIEENNINNHKCERDVAAKIEYMLSSRNQRTHRVAKANTPHIGRYHNVVHTYTCTHFYLFPIYIKVSHAFHPSHRIQMVDSCLPRADIRWIFRLFSYIYAHFHLGIQFVYFWLDDFETYKTLCHFLWQNSTGSCRATHLWAFFKWYYFCVFAVARNTQTPEHPNTQTRVCLCSFLVNNSSSPHADSLLIWPDPDE